MNTNFLNNISESESIIIYTDGGSRGNPGPAGAGGVIMKDSKVIMEISKYLGIQTNNYAEYSALILTLQKAIELNLNNEIIKVYMDSNLIVKQLNGEWKVKHKNIIPLFNSVKQITNSFKNITFTHVYRQHNKLADKLANDAMDSGMNSNINDKNKNITK
jgi:ribonuclease HI